MSLCYDPDIQWVYFGALEVMKALLQRMPSGNDGTPGTFSIDNGTWASLELPWRDNKAGASCIPSGTYSCSLRWSQKHNSNLYGVDGVVGRGDIEIHAGNWAGDESMGLKSDVKGCCILGTRFDHIAPHVSQIAVIESKKALLEFMQIAGGQTFDLEIRDA